MNEERVQFSIVDEEIEINQTNQIENMLYDLLQNNPNQQPIPNTYPQPKMTLLETMRREYQILYKGISEQEYRQYCMVKGASDQTVPLVLFLGLASVQTFILCVQVLIQNLNAGDPIIWTIVKFLFSFLFAIGVLYLLLKTFEIVPKVIKNPLLWGQISSYLFMCLLITEAVFILERNTLIINNTFYKREFWATFALLIWQRVFVTFIYDYRIRLIFYFFGYIYYACRISDNFQQVLFNLHSCLIYIGIEVILIIDLQLKNYAGYQLEKSFIQTSIVQRSQEQLQFMIPPIAINIQQNLLQNYTNIFPIAIFTSSKELIHISGLMQKQLKTEISISANDEVELLQSEITLRKLEVVKVYDDDFNSKENLQKLKKSAKFGSTCGVDANGALLHSLIDGPALQQLRYGTEKNKKHQNKNKNRNFEIQGNKIFENVLNDLIDMPGKDTVSGLLVQKQRIKNQNDSQFGETTFYYQFNLVKDKKNQEDEEFNMILILEDVTSLINLYMSQKSMNQSKQEEIQYLKQLCKNTRAFIYMTEQLQETNFFSEDLIKLISNLEVQFSIKQQLSIHIHPEKLDYKKLIEEIENKFRPKAEEIDLKFGIIVEEGIRNKVFYTDTNKLNQILDNLIQNSLDNTVEGQIKLHIESDNLRNSLSFRIEDSGKGVPVSYFESLDPSIQVIDQILNRESTSNENVAIGLKCSNYVAKIIGPINMNKTIGGWVCGDGLQIQTQQDIFTDVKFSVRDMINDEQGDILIFDENSSDYINQLEINQDELVDRYLSNHEQSIPNVFIFPRTKKNFKCLIIKSEEQDTVKIIQQTLIVKNIRGQAKPKLAGMTKLQDLGKLGQINIQPRIMNSSPIMQSPNVCQCLKILFVSSDFTFNQLLKTQKRKIQWIDRVQFIKETTAIKIIYGVLKENICCPDCCGYSKIIINCSKQNFVYNQLIQSIHDVYEKKKLRPCQIIQLSYCPYGKINTSVLVVDMPNSEWFKLIE